MRQVSISYLYSMSCAMCLGIEVFVPLSCPSVFSVFPLSSFVPLSSVRARDV